MELEITRDQTPTWYALDDFEGVTGIWLDKKWMALGDLEKEDSTEVGKTTIKKSHSRRTFAGLRQQRKL